MIRYLGYTFNRPGFSGEDNEIFYLEKTLMVFGDAKETLTKIVGLVKES